MTQLKRFIHVVAAICSVEVAKNDMGLSYPSFSAWEDHVAYHEVDMTWWLNQGLAKLGVTSPWSMIELNSFMLGLISLGELKAC